MNDIDNYINNRDAFNNPKEEGMEGIKITNQIKEYYENVLKSTNENIEYLKKELEKIKSDVIVRLILDNLKIKFDDEIMKNF